MIDLVGDAFLCDFKKVLGHPGGLSPTYVMVLQMPPDWEIGNLK